MSVINKEPYINKILKLLTAEELETLQECVNGTGSTPVFKSLVANSPYLLTTSDYGIYPARLELALQKAGLAQNVLEGYLIYKENGEAEGTDLCALIAYAGVAQQFLELYIMHKENGVWKWENKTCNLTIIDLRSEMFDASSGQGGGSGGGSSEAVSNEADRKFLSDIQLQTNKKIFPIEKIVYPNEKDEGFVEISSLELKERFPNQALYLKYEGTMLVCVPLGLIATPVNVSVVGLDENGEPESAISSDVVNLGIVTEKENYLLVAISISDRRKTPRSVAIVAEKD